MVKPAPASSFKVAQSQLLLEFLIIRASFKVRELEGAEGYRRRVEDDLPGGERGDGRDGAPGVSPQVSKHQVVADVWERSWQRVIPFFEFPEEIRKIVYMTNAVESLHMTLRKVTKNRGSFPTEEAAIKLIYLALQNVSKKWQFVQGWREALRQITVRWPERIEQATAA